MCVCVSVSEAMTPYGSAHVQWLILQVWPNSCETQFDLICIMPDGSIYYKFYLLKLTMAVDKFVFRIIKGAF